MTLTSLTIDRLVVELSSDSGEVGSVVAGWPGDGVSTLGAESAGFTGSWGGAFGVWDSCLTAEGAEGRSDCELWAAATANRIATPARESMVLRMLIARTPLYS